MPEGSAVCSVKAEIKNTFKELVDGGPGGILWADDKSHFHMSCPGCSEPLRIPVKQEGSIKAKPWEWNGSFDRPTVNPSIVHVKGVYGCGWHGWLKNGVFEEC